MFFGTYKNAKLSAPGQTVHVLLAYQNFMSVLQELTLHFDDPKFEAPKGRPFILSAFAEEDRRSNVFIQMVCDFTVSK